MTKARKRTPSDKQLAANRRNAQKSTGPKTAEGKAITRLNALKHGLLARLEVLPGLERPEDWQDHYQAVLADLRPVGYVEEALAERVALLLWRLGRSARYEREASAVALENAENDVDRSDWRDTGPLPEARRALERVEAQQELLEKLPSMKAEDDIDDDAGSGLLRSAANAIGMDVGQLTIDGYPDGASPEDVDWSVRLLRNALDAAAQAAEAKPEELRVHLLEHLAGRVQSARADVDDLLARLGQYRRQKVLPGPEDLDRVQRYETTMERGLYKALHELQRLQAARQGDPVAAPVAVDVTLDGSQPAA